MPDRLDTLKNILAHNKRDHARTEVFVSLGLLRWLVAEMGRLTTEREADLEQAIRFTVDHASRAIMAEFGFQHSGCLSPECAVAAWRERRAAERGMR